MRHLSVQGTRSARLNNLRYPLASLVGRAEDVARLTEIVPGRKLVTLVGPPGCGKTRLGQEIALGLVDRFRDGAWLVELTSIRDASRIAECLATALGVQDGGAPGPREQVVAYLRDRHCLLVLDNCEHLVGGVGTLAADLLQHCPDLHILATSRQRLGTPGEALWPVRPLEVPPVEVGLAELSTYSAVRLWLARVRDLQPHLQLTPESAPAVTALVRRLDGVPLALELAAAWTTVLSPHEIGERLADRSERLAVRTDAVDDRHRSLHAAIAWSHSLLSDAERWAFVRLSAFRGPCCLDAAGRVCDLIEEETASVIGGLVDKSLLTVTDSADGITRYDMLMTVRQFASEELRRSGDVSAVQARLVEHYSELIARADSVVALSAGEGSARMIDCEHPNVHAAIEYAMQADRGLARRMVVSMCRYWDYRGRWDEASRWLEAVRAERVPATADEVQCLAWLGVMSLGRRTSVGSWQEAERLALAAAQRLEDPALIADCHHKDALVSAHAGDLDRAKWSAQRAVALMDAFEDPRWRASCLFRLGRIEFQRGEVDDAETSLSEGLAAARVLDMPQLIGLLLVTLGQLHLRCGRLADAEACLTAGLQHDEVLNPRQLAALLETLAAVRWEQEDTERAATILGAANRIRTDYSLWGAATTRQYIPGLDRLQTDRRCRRALAMGSKMSRKAVVRFVVADRNRLHDAAPARDNPQVSKLTRRELEVARLVADGLTNRLIASRLGIAERTAEGHVERIRGKLRVHSRTEIASRVAVAMSREAV